MMKRQLALLLVVATTAPAATFAAQEQGTPPEVSAAALERFKALDTEADETMSAWNEQIREKMQKAEAAGEELLESEMVSPLGEFIRKFQAAAKDYAGSEDAVQFHVWIVKAGGQAEPEAAKVSFELLCSTHIKSPGIAPLANILPYLEFIMGDVKSSLVRLASDSSVPSVRDYATFAIFVGVLDTASADSEEFAQAKKKLMATMESTKEKRLKSQIEARIKLADSMGSLAPDIDGIDLDGTAFKLSDYEGKIVFLDFWGDW